MITGREILQARLLLKWSLQQLAQAAKLPLNTVMRAELLDREAVRTVVHAIAIREALEAAGVEFTGGGAVRLRKNGTPGFFGSPDASGAAALLADGMSWSRKKRTRCIHSNFR